MNIEFYEEFPNKENLKKLKLIKFSTKVFIAAKSVSEFKNYEKIARNYKKDLEIVYWPIIKNSYWISPFSNTRDLIELFKELEKIKTPLLIDLESPLNKRLILKNFFSFFINKKLIKNFLERNKNRITTAEFPTSILSFFIHVIGLDYNIITKRSLMWYSSMIPELVNKNIKKNLIKLKNKNQYSISLGTIAHGILGNERILSPEKLERDLNFVKKAGFKKVIIFRLEGINEDYIKSLNKFL